MSIPDALSHAPMDHPTPEDIALSSKTTHYISSITAQRVMTLHAIEGTTSAP